MEGMEEEEEDGGDFMVKEEEEGFESQVESFEAAEENVEVKVEGVEGAEEGGVAPAEREEDMEEAAGEEQEEGTVVPKEETATKTTASSGKPSVSYGNRFLICKGIKEMHSDFYFIFYLCSTGYRCFCQCVGLGSGSSKK